MLNTNNSNKRLESTKKYIDKLQENNSKLNIIRVDLSYKKPYSDEIILEQANKDFDRLYNNMRSKPKIFRDKLGYIFKKEYTKDKGVHLHAIFIFDGQKVQKDIHKAKQIGKYWEKITKDKGTFHNCNRNDYKQKGVGMLDHRDSEKRKILDEDVISYLCKDEQKLKELENNKRVKAFTRGTIPKSKPNIGRPRV